MRWSTKKQKIKIGIISDTHNVLKDEVIDKLKGCDYILHAGDVTKKHIYDRICHLDKPFYLVRGNSDRDTWSNQIPGRQLFTIGGLRFLMVHDRCNVGNLYKQVDIIIFGHTHRFTEEIMNGRLWLNPGSCGRPRFGNQTSMVIMELCNKKYTINKIEV